MEQLVDRALGALVADDPRRAADVALSLLLANLRATAGCVYRCSSTSLELWISRGIDQRDLERAAEAWNDASESILAGHPYTEDDFALFPILDGHALGVVYVSARRPLALENSVVGTLIPLFRQALTSPELSQAPFDDYLLAASREQVERQQLAIQLERHEWNISRVARVLKVERATVYNRMRRLGIVRKHLWKTPRG